jgi:hypothetical protein
METARPPTPAAEDDTATDEADKPEADKPEANKPEGDDGEEDDEEEEEGADKPADAPDVEALRAEAQQDAAASLVKAFNDAFPDVGAQTTDDVIAELRNERQANDVIVGILDEHPEVQAFLRSLATPGATLAEALAQAFPEAAGAPDREADPDGYAAWLKAQGAREAEQRQQQVRLREAEAETARVAETGRKSVQALATAQGWDEAATRRFGETIATFVETPPANFAEVLFHGLNHQRLLDEAVQAARTDERNKAIAEMKSKKTTGGDGVKRFSTAAPAPGAEPQKGSAGEMARRFQQSGGDPLAQLLG